MSQTLSHDDAIEWPNGKGYTPCTREYANIIDQMDAIKPDYVNLDDLSSSDYQEWNSLEDKRASLMADGHLGKSARY